jgi:hypothetical protein
MKKIIIALFVLVPSLGFSQVPHTFKSGDPVSSSKINENFAFVGKRLYLKNNGTTVGIVLSFNENPINKPPYSERDYDFFVTSKNYFHFELFGTFRTPGLHGQVLYTSSNCLGNGYVKESLKRSVNTIFTGTGRKTYYLNSDASATSINVRSMSEFSGSCSSSSGSQTAYLLQENDESITGFPNTIGTLSIAYE